MQDVKPKNEYSLDCTYYTKTFESRDKLLATIVLDGMDPNYEILRNGKPTGEKAIDLIQF